MKPGFFFCGASGTPLLRRDRLGCPWTRMKNLASILRPRVWRRRDLWDSQEKFGSLIMGRVTPCPGKRECDEFFDSDNVLCLCRAADTWRVMHSSPPWTTVAKLSENKSVARGKNKLCPPENASLWPVFWRAQSCLEGIHYTYRDRKKQKKWPHCDWKREMMGLVERFYLAIKQFYEMGLLAAPTEYRTSFLFTMAQSASISQVYNSIIRVQWAASHWFTDRGRDQYRNIKKGSKWEIAEDHPGTNRDARYGFFLKPDVATWFITQKHLDKDAVRNCLTGRHLHEALGRWLDEPSVYHNRRESARR